MSRMERLLRSLRDNHPFLEVTRSRDRRGATRGLPCNLLPSARSHGISQKHWGNLNNTRELAEMIDRFPNFHLKIRDLSTDELNQMLASMDSDAEAQKLRCKIWKRLEKVGKDHPVTLILGKSDPGSSAQAKTHLREQGSVYIWIPNE